MRRPGRPPEPETPTVAAGNCQPTGGLILGAGSKRTGISKSRLILLGQAAPFAAFQGNALVGCAGGKLFELPLGPADDNLVILPGRPEPEMGPCIVAGQVA